MMVFLLVGVAHLRQMVLRRQHHPIWLPRVWQPSIADDQSRVPDAGACLTSPAKPHWAPTRPSPPLEEEFTMPKKTTADALKILAHIAGGDS